MRSPAAAGGRADQIFYTGPEDLVSRSATIITGTVSKYSRDVQRYSTPGSSGLPLEWIARGQIDDPQALKGTAPPPPIYFSRQERSFMAPPTSEIPIWEMNFGELKPGGRVVLFFVEGEEPTAVPSGRGESDLEALVKEIVRIQALSEPAAQRRAWIAYLQGGTTEEGAKVALRSLVRTGADWNEVEGALSALPADPNLRAYAFAFVAFQVARNTWREESDKAADFLCRTFSKESDVEQQLRELQSFKLLLGHASGAGAEAQQKALHDGVLTCLKKWASRGISDQQLAQEYNQIQSQY